MICVSLGVTTRCEMRSFMDVSQATSMRTWQSVKCTLYRSHALIVATHLHTDTWGKTLVK